jgi:Fic family protein
MVRRYIYQYDSWPHFTWDDAMLRAGLSQAHFTQGRITGRLDSFGFVLREQTMISALAHETVASSAIEGERLDMDEVRSSIARMLGVETAGLVPSSHYVEGIVELMLDAVENYREPMDSERLFGWHASLFPTGRSGLHKIKVGAYRDDEMQVVSGAIGYEKVHFQAPPPTVVPKEMERFLEWINVERDCDPLVKAAIAHLWFVIIHPFDDGNGRLARALTEYLLAQSDDSSDRYYSVSAQMLAQRKDYYAALKDAQCSSGDITPWLVWFIECLNRSLDVSIVNLDIVVAKSEFWDKATQLEVNERQRRILNMLLDGFAGKLTTSKWAKINKTSHDTALRDIQDLIEKDILVKEPSGGRSTAYELKGSS